MRKTIVTIVLLAGTLAGCQNFKKDHPDFPKWGWWDKKPATQPTIQPSKPSTKPSKQPTTKPGKQPTAKPAKAKPTKTDAKAKPTKTDAKAQPTKADPKARAVMQTQPIMPAPADHRARVWQHVAKLRDMDTATQAQQDKMVAHAQKNLQAWYRPMEVPPPDMNKSDWVIVMIWDFMPEDDFQRAAANWKKIAADAGEDFPPQKDITRRKLMKFVRKMQTQKN